MHETVLTRLRGRTPFILTVYVDIQKFNEGVSKLQRSRLKALHSLGVPVYLCKGVQATGVFHVKSVVVDRRWLYSGNANVTQHSTANREHNFKLTGPLVATALEDLVVRERARSKLWDGQ